MEGVKYIVEDKNCLLWGLAITTVGVENIEKGEDYPTKKHLKDYYFSTKEGRILQEYQWYTSLKEEVFSKHRLSKRCRLRQAQCFCFFLMNGIPIILTL